MLNILITVFLFNLMLIGLKSIHRLGANNLHVVVINYLVAAVCSYLFSDVTITFSEIVNAPWIFHALIVGLGFVVIFNLLALGTQRVGITITSIANKMSLVIPVGFSLFYYSSDTFSWLKILGIILALIGVYFTSTKNGSLNFDKKYLWLVIVIFFGQGLADMTFNHAQQTVLSTADVGVFFIVLFSVSTLLGTIGAIPNLISKKTTISYKSIILGVLIGVPNYGTLYFFFNALESSGLPPSAVYPLVSMGVVIASTLTGILLFKEQLNAKNWLGIGLAVVAIALLTFI